MNKDELLQMVRFGAEKVFTSTDSRITEDDIERIIAKGEAETAEMDAKMKKFSADAIAFKMDDDCERGGGGGGEGRRGPEERARKGG